MITSSPSLEKIFGVKNCVHRNGSFSEHFTASLAEYAFNELNELEGVSEDTAPNAFIACLRRNRA